jgi:hypothetical protein
MQILSHTKLDSTIISSKNTGNSFPIWVVLKSWLYPVHFPLIHKDQLGGKPNIATWN